MPGPRAGMAARDRPAGPGRRKGAGVSVLNTEAVERILADLERERGPGAWVLEAGCGRWRHFAYPPTMRLAGLDISAEQLARNEWAELKIQADVQDHRCERAFDVVVSIFVLEHVERPGAALRNMLDCLRPGGLLVLAVPDLRSLKGIVTRLTPFWFHEAFYRWVYRRPGSIFPTTMRPEISPPRLRDRLRAEGCEVVHEQNVPERLPGRLDRAYAGLCAVLRALSLGRWRPELSNYLVVARKGAGPGAAWTPTGSGW